MCRYSKHCRKATRPEFDAKDGPTFLNVYIKTPCWHAGHDHRVVTDAVTSIPELNGHRYGRMWQNLAQKTLARRYCPAQLPIPFDPVCDVRTATVTSHIDVSCKLVWPQHSSMG